MRPPTNLLDGQNRSSSRWRRRRVGYLVLALTIAAGLVAVVLGGGHASPRSPQDAALAAAPGIDGPTAKELSLDVLAPGSRPAAPDFRLTDQNGSPLSLSQFRGKTVVLSFNDDQCPDLCTLLAEDVVAANRDMGGAAADVVFLSVNVNPFYPDVQYVKTWTDAHGLGDQANWYFGTAPPSVLQQVWAAYGVSVQQNPDRTVMHGTELFFIDPAGRERAVGDFGLTSADTALFAHAMAQMSVDLLPDSRHLSVGGPATPAATANSVSPGAPAPGFALAPLRPGPGRIRLVADTGKPTVINFWASSCAACRSELPDLEAAYKDFEGKVNFVGVDVADNATAARELAAQARITYQLASDPTGSVAGRYRISGTPFTVIVGPDGRIVTLHPEAFTAEQVEYVLQSYFNDLAPPGS